MKMAWIDTEISGPEPYDQVIELGWVSSEDRGSYLVKLPEHSEMHPKNEELTGITKAFLNEHGLDDFSLPAILNDRIWCSYSLQHDVNWISQTLQIYDHKPLINIPGLCLSEAYQAIFRLNRPIRMQSVLNKMGVTEQIRHRAYPDSVMHYHIYKYLMSIDPDCVKASLKLFNPKPI